ncbi:MAG: hypothetical protein Q7J04_04015, partial [Microcella sp.]|nr:hypothetical protein [Microcella sp.]
MAVGALTLTIGLVVSGCSAETAPPDEPEHAPASGVLLDAEVVPLLETVPRESIAPASMARLADGLVPPTNRWFSGLVFGDEPQPVFPLPLSFRLASSGFSFGVPTITSAPGLIAGPMTDHVSVTTEATSALVTRYDEVSVTIALLSEGSALGDVTIARGSLIIGYRADAAHDLTFDVPLQPVASGDDFVIGGVFSTTVGGAEYGLVAPEGVLSDD